MTSSDYPIASAAGRASLAAGPLFLCLLLIFGYVGSAPAALPVSATDLAAIPTFIFGVVPLSIIVGTLLAFPTCAIIGGVLWFIGSHVPLARPLVVWIAMAVAASFSILHFVDWDAGFASLAFIGTAIGCAVITRSGVCWNGCGGPERRRGYLQ